MAQLGLHGANAARQAGAASSGRRVPAQMWAGVSPVPAQMWLRHAPASHDQARPAASRFASEGPRCAAEQAALTRIDGGWKSLTRATRLCNPYSRYSNSHPGTVFTHIRYSGYSDRGHVLVRRPISWLLARPASTAQARKYGAGPHILLAKYRGKIRSVPSRWRGAAARAAGTAPPVSGASPLAAHAGLPASSLDYINHISISTIRTVTSLFCALISFLRNDNQYCYNHSVSECAHRRAAVGAVTCTCGKSRCRCGPPCGRMWIWPSPGADAGQVVGRCG